MDPEYAKFKISISSLYQKLNQSIKSAFSYGDHNLFKANTPCGTEKCIKIPGIFPIYQLGTLTFKVLRRSSWYFKGLPDQL